MRYPLHISGMDGHSVQVETALWTGATRLLLEGRPAPAGPGKREYLLTRPDGTVAVVRLTGTGLDLTPRVTVDGLPQTLAPPLAWYEWVLVVLPMTLVFVGGGLGGLIGGVALTLNLSLLRGALPAWSRYGAAAGVTVAAYVLFTAAAMAIQPYLPHTGRPAPTYGGPTYGSQTNEPPGMPPNRPGAPGPSGFPPPPPMPGPPPGFPGRP